MASIKFWDNRNFNRRYPRDYGFIRTMYITLFLYLVVWPAGLLFYGTRIKRETGLERGKRYIFTSNHQSYIDAPLISMVANRPVAYMAKEELFSHKSPLIQLLVISLGSFAVNREKPEKATMKTIIDIIKHTKWSIGIFPEGQQAKDTHNFDEVKGGFISIAKMAKMDIVPIAICGFSGYTIIPFRKKMKLKMGEPISYKLSEDEILQKWKDFMNKEVKDV